MHFLKDPRTGTFNFDPHLHRITQPKDFNFECVPPFVPASLDTSLHELAATRKARFVSSTSSIAPSMSLLYFLLSKGRQLSLRHLSMEFRDELRTYTALTRAPVAVVVRPHGDVRSVLVEKLDNESILSQLGHTLERFLTEHPQDFNKMLLENAVDDLEESVGAQEGVFHYTQCGDLLLRSQIDCMDPRLPRRTFDLKTRATLPIRMDLMNYQKYLNYRLDRQHGMTGSFERELYDMSRSAFLKYNLQARIGNMDGIFVAYHNTAELFGFQYLPREWIDECVFGSAAAGDLAFNLLLQSYGHLLEVALSEVPKEHVVRLTFSLGKDYNRMSMFVEHFKEYPTERRIIMPPADSFTQYNLQFVTKANGIRLDAFPGTIEADFLREAQLASQLTVSLVKEPSRAEFEQARARCGETRPPVDDMSSVSAGIMRQLNNKK